MNYKVRLQIEVDAEDELDAAILAHKLLTESQEPIYEVNKKLIYIKDKDINPQDKFAYTVNKELYKSKRFEYVLRQYNIKGESKYEITT